MSATVLPLRRPNAPERTSAQKLRQDFSPASLFEQVIHLAPDIIVIVDLRGRFSFVNDRSMELTGFTRDELVGSSVDKVIDPRDVARIRRFYLRQYVRRKERTYLELPIRTKNGKQMWLGVTVVLQHVYRIPAFIAIARDISDKKRAEDALVESEQKYRELFNHAVQGMFQSTPDGKLVSANPALLKLLGYDTLEELAAVDIRDLYVNPVDREILAAMLNEKGYCAGVELQLKQKNGRVITVLEHSRAIRDTSGKVKLYEGILEDITFRKAHEAKLQELFEALQRSERELKELNAQKDKLFSVLSHDLRSPFSSILGFVEILLNEAENVTAEERREFLLYIKEAANSQLALVNRLLEWSRLESNRVKVDIKDTDLSELIARSIIGLMGLARQKGVFVHSTITRKLVVGVDEQLMMQVFTNLISNALKFTPTGGEVRIELTEETGDALKIAVRDTGIGIPKEDLPKLFKIEEKYSRLGLSGEKGTGLGLPMCAEIMQLLNGSITAESEVGVGTSFILTFPKPAKLNAKEVLVVDDDKGVRVLHSRHVKQLLPDATIHQAANGKEALEILERHNPSLVLSDYSMPEMDGQELVARMRGSDQWKNIPVIIITGIDSVGSREKLLAAGANEVLSKPVNFRELSQVLANVLQRAA
ncbi:MAG TPA: PAS domain S-box protein [Bacteroidota bacterium]|nr:PAS domain S-box protein [Bacteroidota bacterium]